MKTKLKYFLSLVLMALLCFGSIDATAQRTIRRGERPVQPVNPTPPANPTKEQKYQKDLNAGEKLFDQKKFSEAKMHFAKMLGKYPKHKEEINGWIAACDMMLDDEAPVVQTQSQQSSQATSGYINGHEYVDLGLPSGLKWATCNVGASSPSDYGNRYAWGEITTKQEYTIDNCKTYGKSMGDISGSYSYDAARANWGGSWRMPTEAEFEELLNNCTWEWTSQGHYGYKFTSKKNGKSIFFPAKYSHDDYGCYYWSSTPYESGDDCAYDFRFDSHYCMVDWCGRSNALAIRPVSD